LTSSNSALVSLVLIAAVAGCAEDACRGSDAKYYNEGLRYQLAKREVPHRVSGEVICVSGRRADDLRAAEAELDRTFHEVADLLKDSCEERAVVEWATKEKLRFDVRESTSGSSTTPVTFWVGSNYGSINRL